MPGWLVSSEGDTTVALDINITDELKQEGIAREMVNRIQNLRKELGFEVTDHIQIEYSGDSELQESANNFSQYIASEVLASSISFNDSVTELQTEVYEKPLFLRIIKS